jgi:hypothetical protein
VIKPTRLNLARLWLALHPGAIGSLVAILLVCALFAVRYAPVRTATLLWGRVERFDVQSTKTGSRQTAHVLLDDGRTVTLDLPFRGTCQVGSRMRLTVQWHLWGLEFRTGWPICDPDWGGPPLAPPTIPRP